MLTAGKSWQDMGGTFNLLIGGAYSEHEVDTRRNVAVGRLNESLTAGYDANTTHLFGEISYSRLLAERSIISTRRRRG